MSQLGNRKRPRGGLGLGKIIVRLGREHFDRLEEGNFLGKETLGTVLSGTYKGEEVAIQKIRGEARSNPAVLKALRCAFSLCACLR